MLNKLKDIYIKRKENEINSSEFGSLIVGICIGDLLNKTHDPKLIDRLIALAGDLEIDEKDKEYRINPDLSSSEVEDEIFILIEKLFDL